MVLVVFDEMPTASLMTPGREIDAGRYPNFARLAETATWYREATTVSQATIYAVPAILTGNYPEAKVRKSPSARDYKRNLFTELGETLDLNVWETMSHLCPNRLCSPPERWLVPRRQRLVAMLSDSAAVFVSLVAPAGWGGALPTLEDQWRDFWGAAPAPSASEAPRTMSERSKRPGELFDWFLNTIEQRESGPAVHYAHVMLPHRPWVWLPGGQRFASYLPYPHGLRHQSWAGSEWETTQGHQRHLLTVGFVDTLVGRLMDTLERSGIFDETMIVITSDHGSTFRTGRPRRNLRLEPTYEIVGVPLFVKYPQQRTGEIDDRNAETIDIVPTIYAALGHQPAKPLEGKDLRGPENAKPELKRTFLSGNKKASAGGVLEYSIADQDGRQAALDDIARRFGTGSWEALFAAGPRPDLLDRRLSRLSGDRRARRRGRGDLRPGRARRRRPRRRAPPDPHLRRAPPWRFGAGSRPRHSRSGGESAARRRPSRGMMKPRSARSCRPRPCVAVRTGSRSSRSPARATARRSALSRCRIGRGRTRDPGSAALRLRPRPSRGDTCAASSRAS